MPLGDGTQFWDSLISSIDYKNICDIPLPRIKKLRARNGSVTRNRDGNRLERKTRLCSLNYRAFFISNAYETGMY